MEQGANGSKVNILNKMECLFALCKCYCENKINFNKRAHSQICIFQLEALFNYALRKQKSLVAPFLSCNTSSAPFATTVVINIYELMLKFRPLL
jgi:hypothetical protein